MHPKALKVSEKTLAGSSPAAWRRAALKKIGLAMAAWRKEQGVSREQVALETNRSYCTVANWEYGKSEPGVYDVYRMIRIWGGDLFRQLVDAIDESGPSNPPRPILKRMKRS